ncbi:MAG: LapA family protein [Candidatus Didemnitutus sp.]|nr:LapA family protein [Candidatus Didemnitutus sp.]
MKIRRYSALVALALLGIFAAQNLNQLNVRFLFWSLQVPQALLIVATGAIGVVVGLIFGTTGRSVKRN